MGIVRHKTMRLTPQQNSLAEMMNMTILERVRCLLSNVKLNKRFWGEVVHTACYLIHRSPYAGVSFKTLEELWTDRAPSYENLKKIGCTESKEGRAIINKDVFKEDDLPKSRELSST